MFLFNTHFLIVRKVYTDNLYSCKSNRKVTPSTKRREYKGIYTASIALVNLFRESRYESPSPSDAPVRMLQTWNKFCFTGGYLEASVRQPGPAGGSAVSRFRDGGVSDLLIFGFKIFSLLFGLASILSIFFDCPGYLNVFSSPGPAGGRAVSRFRDSESF